MSWIALCGVDLMAALVQSGRRSSRSFATSATPTVWVTAVTAVMTIGVATTATTTATITGTTIGGDEFQSLGTNPHLTSACNLLVYPAKRPRLQTPGPL